MKFSPHSIECLLPGFLLHGKNGRLAFGVCRAKPARFGANPKEQRRTKQTLNGLAFERQTPNVSMPKIKRLLFFFLFAFCLTHRVVAAKGANRDMIGSQNLPIFIPWAFYLGTEVSDQGCTS
jgi:hypothetical protein